MSSYIDWSKTTKSKDYRGSSSFATFLVIGPTCFFLGILFASFPYDFPLLWTKDPVALNYYDQLETHLKFIHQSPPLIGRLLNIIMSVGFLGLFIKLFRPSEANFLFDGASLILYIIGVAVYISNIVKGDSLERNAQHIRISARWNRTNRSYGRLMPRWQADVIMGLDITPAVLNTWEGHLFIIT